MCGIGGAINFKRNSISPETIQKIEKRIDHRGPDDYGYFFYANGDKTLTRNISEGFDFNVAFLHRRLSILDLSTNGWQPMQTPDRRFTITFNGEVYNYVEIKKALKKKGYNFLTETDTEVILYAYQEWGVNCLSHFNGMFAFAIHDSFKNELFLVRDPFGIKPLFYTQTREYFLFCSEIKGILEEEKVSRRINPERLSEYLDYGWVNHTTESIYIEIKDFPPAHYSLIDCNSFTPVKTVAYWNPEKTETRKISFEDAALQVKEIFYNNVKIHLRSDVEVGYTLSGGIDSSSIVGVANDILPGNRINSFSYIPNYEGKSEKKWIDIVNNRVGARPQFTQPSEKNFIEEIENIIKLQDEPFGGTSIYAQYKLFELIKEKNIKVVLDGQGADEIFAGYTFYFSDRALTILKTQGFLKYIQFIKRIDPVLNLSKLKLIIKGLNQYLPKSLQQGIKNKYKSQTPRFLQAPVQQQSEESQIFPSPFENDHLKSSLYRRLKFIGLPWLLRYQDRNSMAFSVEGRVPFLTKDLVEFVFSLPEDFILTNDGYTKKLMRDAMKDFLPVEILNRKDKIGFETPEKEWIKNSHEWTSEILSSRQGEIFGINLKSLRKEFKEINGGQKGYSELHWRYLNFLRWAEINKVSI